MSQMKSTLADSLEILLPALPAELAMPEVVPPLQRLASFLAPIPRGGFECRLAPNSPQVDLQQCIVCRDGEPAALGTHIAAIASTEASDHPAWDRIRAFCTAWGDASSPLHDGVAEIWLEFDVDGPVAQMPAPSFFFGLQRKALPVDEARSVAEVTLRLLLSEPGVLPWHRNLRRCFEACEDGGRVSHIGVMLSRQSEALRVNVKGLASNQISAYLARAGWQGPTDELETVATQLFEFVDSITVCLDVGATIDPKIGLECILDRQPDREPRWSAFLNDLVRRGLCAPDKRDGLLAWPGHTDPTSNPHPWPNHLITESLLHPPDQFSIFERRLSHIKIVYRPQRPLEAKGYLWFNHQWARPTPTQSAEMPLTDSDPRAAIADTNTAYREQVRAYYDSTTTAYLAHLGATFQADLVTMGAAKPNATVSNLNLASQADIRPGHRVLDAGCGVCGPAVDIARGIENVTIDAITLSPIQAHTSLERIHASDMAERIRIYIGDYHNLPFSNETFEVVVFFESFGYSYAPAQVISEVYRVLQPNGMLYMKEGFRRAGILSEAEKRELSLFDQIYAYRSRTMSRTVEEIAKAGFQYIQSRDLTDIASKERWTQAMGTFKGEERKLTMFGELHFYPFKCLPIFCGEVKARKPG